MSDFVREANGCSSANSLWVALGEFIENSGIQHWRYIYLPPFEEALKVLNPEKGITSKETSQSHKITTLSEEIPLESQRRLKKYLRRVESIEKLSTFLSQHKPSSDVSFHINEILGHGSAHEVLLMPVFGSRGHNGCVIICLDSISSGEMDARAALLSSACQIAHQLFHINFSSQKMKPTSLSPRETQILEGLSRGLSNFSIASELGISPHTVNGYLQRIFLKTDCNDRTTAVLNGLAGGLIH